MIIRLRRFFDLSRSVLRYPAKTDMTPRLKLQHITKAYPGIIANNDITLEVNPGEVLTILGENGAGKSTLMKIIFGSVAPDSGTIEFDGKPVEIASPSVARDLGIAMVHQHFALFETLTVAQNVILGIAEKLSVAQASEKMYSQLSGWPESFYFS